MGAHVGVGDGEVDGVERADGPLSVTNGVFASGSVCSAVVEGDEQTGELVSGSPTGVE